MKFLSENLRNLRELYINQLRMLVSAERQIVIALPTMIEKSTDKELRQALQAHLQETEIHVHRVEEILKTAAGGVDPIKCKVLSALVGETEDMIQDARDTAVRDVALIAAAQRVEHYEIAAYGAVRQWAQLLGEERAAQLLDMTIKEEGHADHVFTSIAERVNLEAKKAA
jgi:ferritin-like metal-binding protein YciE